MTNGELIESLTILKEQARYYGDNTFVWSISIDSFKFVIDSAIKTLEQEPTNKIEESNFSQEQYLADIQSAYDCGFEAGKKAEQEPRWIPVSEKLPEDDKDVLIFTIAESIYKACHSLKEWTEDHYEWFVIGTIGWSLTYEEDEVLAWMPLPEPYKGVKE